MDSRHRQLITVFGATLGVVGLGVATPSGTAAAAPPAPRDLLCQLLGVCPTEPADGTVVVLDLEGLGTTSGTVIDNTVATLDTVLPGTADVLGGLPVDQLPAPIGGVVGGLTGGSAAPTLETVTQTVESTVNGVLGEVTTLVDGTLDQLGLGNALAADAQISVDLTDGLVVQPTLGASVDLGGATSAVPVPLPELVDADVAVSLCGVNVAVLADHAQDCSNAAPAPATISTPVLADVKLPIDVCGVQVVVLGSDTVDCSTSGGNQNGGATGASSGALIGVNGAVGVCGVQVGVLGSASADCSGRDTGAHVGACLAGTCTDVLTINELCRVQAGLLANLDVTCAPGRATDPGDGPGSDPGDTPEATDPGDTPEGVGPGDTPGGDDSDTPGTDGPGTHGPGDDTPDTERPADERPDTDTPDTDQPDDEPTGTGGGGGGGGGGRGGRLPLTGLSIGTFLGLGGGLVVTGLIARRVRTFAAVR